MGNQLNELARSLVRVSAKPQLRFQTKVSKLAQTKLGAADAKLTVSS